MKRKKLITPIYERPAIKTPKQIPSVNLTESERLFVWLHAIIGLTIAESYKLSHRKSTANLNSCSSLGSRLLAEDSIKCYINRLDRFYNDNPLEVRIKL